MSARRVRVMVLVMLLLLAAAAAALFAVQQEKERDGHWPWPLNGEINNRSAQAVVVWDDDHGNYQIPAHSQSRRDWDVDHAQEPASGRWCKLGPHVLQVNPDGRFANCECYSLAKGRPCIKF
ncbi:hypothetical protein [Chitinibacter tainanensis]|uniref:hypothetical protein n=1 Tax=Chitinibacter tainanensis TaxID=230667 RepID=UPI002353EB20|nr:hypothetical protein [Chitinibacter tainanensis]